MYNAIKANSSNAIDVNLPVLGQVVITVVYAMNKWNPKRSNCIHFFLMISSLKTEENIHIHNSHLEKYFPCDNLISL